MLQTLDSTICCLSGPHFWMSLVNDNCCKFYIKFNLIILLNVIQPRIINKYTYIYIFLQNCDLDFLAINDNGDYLLFIIQINIKKTLKRINKFIVTFSFQRPNSTRHDIDLHEYSTPGAYRRTMAGNGAFRCQMCTGRWFIFLISPLVEVQDGQDEAGSGSNGGSHFGRSRQDHEWCCPDTDYGYQDQVSFKGSDIQYDRQVVAPLKLFFETLRIVAGRKLIPQLIYCTIIFFMSFITRICRIFDQLLDKNELLLLH